MSKTVVCYVRTSTADKQDTELQIRELRQYAAARGWTISRVYEDKGFTGTNDRRPAFQEMIRASRQRKHDLILCWRLDRIGRSLKEVILLLHELTELGVGVCSMKESLDLSTSQGRLMAGLLSVFAQYEAEIIKSRVLAGLALARSRGKKLGRPQVRDDEKIWKLRDAGLSQREIAAKLSVSKGSVQNALRKRTTIPLPSTPTKSLKAR